MPTPREKRHSFFRSSVSVYRFHTTVTEPDNLPLTQEQHGQQHFDDSRILDGPPFLSV